MTYRQTALKEMQSSVKRWMGIAVCISVFFFTSLGGIAEASSLDNTAMNISVSSMEMNDLAQNHSDDHDMHAMECMSFQCHAMAMFEIFSDHVFVSDEQDYFSFSQELIASEATHLKRPPRHV